MLGLSFLIGNIGSELDIRSIHNWPSIASIVRLTGGTSLFSLFSLCQNAIVCDLQKRMSFPCGISLGPLCIQIWKTQWETVNQTRPPASLLDVPTREGHAEWQSIERNAFLKISNNNKQHRRPIDLRRPNGGHTRNVSYSMISYFFRSDSPKKKNRFDRKCLSEHMK